MLKVCVRVSMPRTLTRRTSEIVICAFFYDSLKKQSWYSKYIRDSTLTSISAVRWIYLERTDLTP